MLDNQASANIFSNAHLLTDIRKAENGIILNGVQADATGVRVELEGNFSDVGAVYYSEKASANILSMGAMVDAGEKLPTNKKQID